MDEEKVAVWVDAQKADEIMDAVCDGRIPTRAELKEKVHELLAACANEARLEALERAAALADRADSSGMVFAGKTVPVAYAIRALKEATP